MRPPRHTVLTVDPDEEWALVELYRRQTGRLPTEGPEVPLDIPAGLRAMAVDPMDCSPYDVSCVLKYVAKLLESK